MAALGMAHANQLARFTFSGVDSQAMKTLLILTLLYPQVLDWKKVTSGPVMEIYVAEIARGPKEVKFWLKFDFPNGAPVDLLPVHGVSSVHTEATFNCVKQSAKLTNGYGLFYDWSGNLIKKVKDKEIVKAIPGTVGQYILEYFCEQPSPTPKTAPTLKPK